MDYRASAAALYDGDWRKEDLDQLMAEYDLSKEDAEKICKILAEFEDAEDAEDAE